MSYLDKLPVTERQRKIGGGDRDSKGRQLKGGASINPYGGGGRKTFDFRQRLSTEDADEIYRALMDLVAERNVLAVLRAVEYLAGKPHTKIEIATEPKKPELDFSRLSLSEKIELERLMVLASTELPEAPSRASEAVIEAVVIKDE